VIDAQPLSCSQKVRALAGLLRRVAALVVVAFGAFLAAGSALAQLPDEGQAIFEQKCVGCHTIGGGQLVGPDLEGVIGRLGADEVRAFMLAPGDVRPGTAMPDLGLSDAEADALVAYLDAAEGGSPPATEPPPAPIAGDAALGKNLFTGSDRLENGGPPCLSCHSVAGIGALGGGALGPDLTQAYAKYGGAQGLASVLQAIAFPTMQPIYADQPLTAAEVESLVAFLADAPAAERPAGSVGILIGLAIAAISVFAILALVVWKRRLIAVRRPLVHRPNPRQK
jgi:mono/diheme cytochrome c family protein